MTATKIRNFRARQFTDRVVRPALRDVALILDDVDPSEDVIRDACAAATAVGGVVRVIRVVDDRESATPADRVSRAALAREQIGRVIARIRAGTPNVRVSGQLHRGTLRSLTPALDETAATVMTNGGRA
jgi:hypothetical protein